MKNNFRQIELSLVIIMTLSLFAFSGSVSASSFSFDMNELGITAGMNPEQRKTEYVRRDEFAKMVVNMMQQQDVAKSLENAAYFTDVADSQYKGAINLLAQMGYISGSGNGEYRPDEYLTYGAACKILVHALGYDKIVEDSSLNAYQFVAGTIKLTNNVDSSAEYMTFAQTMLMIHNALDIGLMVPSYHNANIAPSYEIDEGRTYRSMLYGRNGNGIVKMRGIVTADVTTYLTSQRNSMKQTQLEVDGVLFDYNGVAPKGLVGMEAEMYVSTIDGEYDKIQAITATNKNNVVEIVGEDIASFKDDEIGYLIDDTRIEKIETDESTSYIYNNNIDNGFDPDSLNYDNKITVRAIDNNNDEIYDVVYVYEYTDRVVKSIFAENEVAVLTTQYKGNYNLVLNEEETKSHVEYLDENGNSTDFSAIKEDSVLSIASSKDGYSIRVVVSNRTLQGFVEEKDDEYITIDGNEYTYSNDVSAIRMGSNVKVLLSFYGKIVDFEELNSSTDYAFVYATQVPSSGFGQTKVQLILPDTVSSETIEGAFDETTNSTTKSTNLYVNNSNMLIYYLNSKVRVNGKIYSAEKAAEIIRHQAVRYVVDSENKITKVDFLKPIQSYDTETVYQKMNYNSSENVFGKSSCEPFAVGDKTYAVCIPVTSTSSNVMDIASLSDTELLNFKMELTNNTIYRVSGYEVDENTHIASFVIVFQNSSAMKVGGDGVLQTGKKYIGMVTKAGQALDAETGNEVIKMELLTIGNEKTLSSQTIYVSDIISSTAKFKNVTKGDLIWYSLDYFGRMDNVDIIKKHDDYNRDGVNKEYTDYETHTYSVHTVDFDELDGPLCRWVDVISLYSENSNGEIVKTFNIPQTSSLAPVVFVLEEDGNARIGSIKEICVNDRICMYNPVTYGYVAAVVIRK